MICHERQFIFVHIRKTGGTSVEALLVDGPEARSKAYRPGAEPVAMNGGKNGHKHWRLSRYDRHFVDAYFTFSIVRNPWDRAVSRYFWEKQHNRRSVQGYEDFGAYIRARRSLPAERWNIDGERKAKYRTQFDYLALDGKVAVDAVLRFETLAIDFEIISPRLGLEGQALPHLFSSERGHYSDYYDADTRDIVHEAYQVDVEAFDYSFGET